MCICGACGREFQFGPHRYEGKHIPRYQWTVGDACWTGNYDGWSPHVELALLAHLDAKGLPVPERNENGWLPRE